MIKNVNVDIKSIFFKKKPAMIETKNALYYKQLQTRSQREQTCLQIAPQIIQKSQKKQNRDYLRSFLFAKSFKISV